MPTTPNSHPLPHANIGGYGAIVRRMETTEDVAQAFMSHAKDVETLAYDLAAAIARRDVAWAEVMRRNGGQ